MAIQLKSCGVLLLIVIILYINHVKSDMIADERKNDHLIINVKKPVFKIFSILHRSIC